ncbi:hypothetical protein U1872_15905 [Sphingomonas sp. RB3P16]|uniref:linalool dehydratase/isomerase domain-containing protein n=1 Tax=Parasphingomonas frigoris TaxID=3096163 RepID=UPI002FCC36DA
MSDTHHAAGLDREQVGHLRHFANLSRQKPNDWSLMKGRSIGQDDFGGYRFQLAYMMYALALAHIHRLPAAPGVFKPIFERLFEKLLLPEVWMYWRDVSRGGSIFNAHLSDRYHEEWDPVGRDNIMYSAYVQSAALLFHYLFRDDRFARPEAIAFRHWSFFWGGEPKEFLYDENSLNEHVYWLMAESGFLGVACEPNCIFQICNQPAILGFRLHDLIHGQSRADEVIRGYEAAWSEFGRAGDDGHFLMMVTADSRTPRPNALRSPWVDAWTGALMNAWNRDLVRALYPLQSHDLLVTGPDDTISVRVPQRPEVMGQRIVSDDCDFGWAAVWTSEVGDKQSLTGLLRHADRFMHPTWADGGLYYPRNDQIQDAEGNRTLVEPHTGNVLLGYSRLNVPDGLWKLYNRPLDDGFFEAPALIRIDEDIAVSRAFVREGALHFDIAGPLGNEVIIGRMPQGCEWTLQLCGEVVAEGCGAGTPPGNEFVRAVEDGLAVRCTSNGLFAFTLTMARRIEA